MGAGKSARGITEPKGNAQIVKDMSLKLESSTEHPYLANHDVLYTPMAYIHVPHLCSYVKSGKDICKAHMLHICSWHNSGVDTSQRDFLLKRLHACDPCVAYICVHDISIAYAHLLRVCSYINPTEDIF